MYYAFIKFCALYGGHSTHNMTIAVQRVLWPWNDAYDGRHTFSLITKS